MRNINWVFLSIDNWCNWGNQWLSGEVMVGICVVEVDVAERRVTPLWNVMPNCFALRCLGCRLGQWVVHLLWLWRFCQKHVGLQYSFSFWVLHSKFSNVGGCRIFFTLHVTTFWTRCWFVKLNFRVALETYSTPNMSLYVCEGVQRVCVLHAGARLSSYMLHT